MRRRRAQAEPVEARRRWAGLGGPACTRRGATRAVDHLRQQRRATAASTAAAASASPAAAAAAAHAARAIAVTVAPSASGVGQALRLLLLLLLHAEAVLVEGKGAGLRRQGASLLLVPWEHGRPVGGGAAGAARGRLGAAEVREALDAAQVVVRLIRGAPQGIPRATEAQRRLCILRGSEANAPCEEGAK